MYEQKVAPFYTIFVLHTKYWRSQVLKPKYAVFTSYIHTRLLNIWMSAVHVNEIAVINQIKRGLLTHFVHIFAAGSLIIYIIIYAVPTRKLYHY